MSTLALNIVSVGLHCKMDTLCLHEWLDLASSLHVSCLNLAAADAMGPFRLTHAVHCKVHRKQDALRFRLSLLVCMSGAVLQLWLLQAPWALQADRPLLSCGAGGMSMQPVTIPTGLQIFKGIKAMGFWLSKCPLPAVPLSYP